MIDFGTYLQECMDGVPAITGAPGSINLHNPEDRDSVNFVLSDLTDLEFSPERAYERIRTILDDIRYLIPPASSHTELFVDGAGEAIIPLVQESSQEPVFLYFAYASDDETEHYEILAEIMTESELEELLDEDIE